MTEPLTNDALSGAGIIAQAILDGSTTFISGAREIAQLATAHQSAALDEDFAPFVIFDHRTFDLPTGAARQHWAADALTEKDAQLAAVEAELGPEALAACRRLIARFGSRL
jgi:hypothetical protein